MFVWRCAPLRPVSAQAQGAAGRPRQEGLLLAVQLLLRRGWVPPSLRFLGRRVYLASMVVLISVMRHGATAPRVARLSQLIGVSRRTVAHWREWWRTAFAQSRFWQAARAAFMPPVDQDRLPASLLERFAGGGAEQLLALLRFLAPITGGAVHAS
jgi:hypothetical protein